MLRSLLKHPKTVILLILLGLGYYASAHTTVLLMWYPATAIPVGERDLGGRDIPCYTLVVKWDGTPLLELDRYLESNIEIFGNSLHHEKLYEEDVAESTEAK